VAGADYVAEAVSEDLPLKQALFRDLDVLARPEAVLASNTSSYDPAALAAGLAHPERVLVAHYFAPAYLIPLVEVVPHAGTAPAAVQRTLSLLREAGKLPILLGAFAPGFVANRLQQALFREALALVRHGIATPEQLDTVVRWAFGPRLAALGPFATADLAGLDVYAAIAAAVWPSLSAEQGTPPEVAARQARGELGAKTGRGFYEWTPARWAEVVARRDAALAAALRAAPRV